MIKDKIGTPEGFRVIHESGEWRIAYHAYKEDVNSMKALKKWGVHVESDEAFILIKGNMLISVAGTLEAPKPVETEKVEPGVMYCVEKGERHAIALEEGAVVLIVENRDMSNFIETEIENDNLAVIRERFAQM